MTYNKTYKIISLGCIGYTDYTYIAFEYMGIKISVCHIILRDKSESYEYDFNNVPQNGGDYIYLRGEAGISLADCLKKAAAKIDRHLAKIRQIHINSLKKIIKSGVAIQYRKPLPTKLMGYTKADEAAWRDAMYNRITCIHEKKMQEYAEGYEEAFDFNKAYDEGYEEAFGRRGRF